MDTTTKCQCGQLTGERCDHGLEPGHIIEIEHMPEYLRASHEAASGAVMGYYPDNGAKRLLVSQECAAASDLLDDWTQVVRKL